LILGGLIVLEADCHSGHLSSNLERELRNESKQTLLRYALSGHCIEATFENWESEFLAVGVLLELSIFLLRKGSPESKPVNAPHLETAKVAPNRTRGNVW
jgi:hypothetical protein